MPKLNYVILWPAYFDSRLPRSEGRIVGKNLAVENPTAEEILKAAESLGYVKKIEEGAYPRTWWSRSGKIVVEKKGKKTEIVKKIAQKMKASRPAQGTGQNPQNPRGQPQQHGGKPHEHKRHGQ